MIALGLTVELLAGALLAVGLALGEPRAAVALWSSVAAVLVGLTIASVGVARARPPLRAAVVPPMPQHQQAQPPQPPEAEEG